MTCLDVMTGAACNCEATSIIGCRNSVCVVVSLTSPSLILGNWAGVGNTDGLMERMVWTEAIVSGKSVCNGAGLWYTERAGAISSSG